MQLETADFAPSASTWRSRPNNVVWCSTGVAIWRTGRNMRVVFDSGLFSPVYGNMTLQRSVRDNATLNIDVYNNNNDDESHKTGSTWRFTLPDCRQKRTEPRPQKIRTENMVKFGRVVLAMRVDRQTDRHTETLIIILRTPRGTK